MLSAGTHQRSARSVSQPIDQCTSRVFVLFTVASYWYWFPLPWFPVVDLLLFPPSLCSFSSSQRPSTAALAVYFALLQYVKWIFLLLVYLGFFLIFFFWVELSHSLKIRSLEIHLAADRSVHITGDPARKPSSGIPAGCDNDRTSQSHGMRAKIAYLERWRISFSQFLLSFVLCFKFTKTKLLHLITVSLFQIKWPAFNCIQRIYKLIFGRTPLCIFSTGLKETDTQQMSCL